MKTAINTVIARSQSTHPLSTAERTTKLLAFKSQSYNFTTARTPSKVIPVASSAFATA
jgi:hypothetical protein